MKRAKEIINYIENMTLAELKDEIELLEMFPTKYPKFVKELLLAELEKRNKK